MVSLLPKKLVGLLSPYNRQPPNDHYPHWFSTSARELAVIIFFLLQHHYMWVIVPFVSKRYEMRKIYSMVDINISLLNKIPLDLVYGSTNQLINHSQSNCAGWRVIAFDYWSFTFIQQTDFKSLTICALNSSSSKSRLIFWMLMLYSLAPDKSQMQVRFIYHKN